MTKPEVVKITIRVTLLARNFTPEIPIIFKNITEAIEYKAILSNLPVNNHLREFHRPAYMHAKMKMLNKKILKNL